MPPHVPRKRVRTPSPATSEKAGRRSAKGKGKAGTPTTAPPRKPTVFENLEVVGKNRSAEKTKSAIQQMQDDSSSLSSLEDSDVEFEDVPATKRQKVAARSDDEEDEDIEFEDVPNHEHQPEPVISGDLELTLYQNSYVPLASDLAKKGASKREKMIRNATHCIHVQFLLWHNTMRNSWICDQEVQAIMISHLTPRLWEEVDRWRRNSALEIADVVPKSKPKTIEKGTAKAKGKKPASRPTRDWGEAAERLEKEVPDMSHGDPLLRLMKTLSAWWKQKFKITAPGLRRFGYMDVRRLAKWRQAFEKEDHDPERFGEKIIDLDNFRRHAQRCEGSRDVGAQLFTALLRGLGLNARMVANIQSLGFGWSKSEDADEEKIGNETQANSTSVSRGGSKQPAAKKKTPTRPASRRAKKNDKDALRMDLDDSDEYAEPIVEDSDDDAVVEVVSESPWSKAALKAYDKDLEFPHYWTEVLSPVTQKYLPVDPIVKSVIGNNRELIESLEPRGGKADKAKQIMAYVIGYSQDGTAKDVTVRYLRKQLFPGRTKGVRMGIEKVPIYNRHDRVKRYEMFDWFRFVMRGYIRGGRRNPITEVDEAEDSTDLKPAVPEKKEVKEGEETLQYYKTSKEFVLARHLKREEALLPTAAPVKVFRNKSKGGRVEEENVYLRKDVVSVKSAETWHKQGRAPVLGAEPLKHAPYRAATTNRRREIAEAESRTGEKVLQPLYSFEQTEWIIPDPIENGVIPKNEYGNIDMFAEHMCPAGAIHLPYRGSVRVCKRLGIDYAEAVVGFEFGHRMAVPVIQGVVVAEEHGDRVIKEIEKDEAERARKEDEKRRKAALGMWRKLLMGLRIAARITKEYGHIQDTKVVVSGHEMDDDDDAMGGFEAMRQRDEDMGGGFLPEGYEDEEPDEPRHMSGYFPVAHDDDGEDPFEIDHGPQEHDTTMVAEKVPSAEPEHEEDEEQAAQPAPNARGRRKVAKPKPKAKPKAPSNRRRVRKNVGSFDEEEEEDDEDFAL
jgi:xeroderma pigmentosum group C-complementing protein